MDKLSIYRSTEVLSIQYDYGLATVNFVYSDTECFKKGCNCDRV